MEQSTNLPGASAKAENLQEQLRLLQRNYASRLPEKVAQIEETCRLMISGTGNGDAVRALHRMTHSLAGSAATFGFNEVGEAARILEVFLKAMLQSHASPGTVHLEQVKELLSELQRAAAICEDKVRTQKITVKPRSKTKGPSVVQAQDNSILYFCSATGQRDLMSQLVHFGYNATEVDNLDRLKVMCASSQPAAVLLDIETLVTGEVNASAVSALRQMHDLPLPVVFLSDTDSLAVRLQAVRAGGDAYLVKPVDVGALVDKLDLFTAHQAPDPFRVLIVDDEQSLADLYAFVLQQAEMKTVVVNHPLEVMQPLIDFKPDLILMDVHMPGCNGLELAATIRQQESFVSIPIIFISTDRNYDRQLDAMRLGGDDFLTKPIQPDHLLAAVTSRARRARTLRSLMERDSLTGLFNHTKTKEHLDVEVARARRQETTLTLAMIDIDHFKSVNDRFGHAAGDRVIKSLSRLLQQRLRKTDVIGRYGGEEFAVILHGADGPMTVQIMEEIRSRFAQIRHLSEGREFTVTFSCGIATLEYDEDATTLNAAADKVLYDAKRRGRNCVLLENPSRAAPPTES